MEISSLSSSVKIKGKQTALVVDPNVKTTADMVIKLSASEIKSGLVEGSRLLIGGPGEYEVGGVKVSAVGGSGELVYMIRIDGLDVSLSTPEGFSAVGEKLKESQVVIVHAKSVVDSAFIAALTPSVVVLYGDHAAEGAKSLGKEANKVAKYVTTAEKLPAEMEVVVLG